MHHCEIKRFVTTCSELHTKIKNLISQELYEQALIFYAQHVHPFQLTINTAFIVPSITKACAHSQSHRILGKQLHCNVIKNGFDSDFTVSNSLLSMYAKFSDSKLAQKVFDEMPSRDTISWNSMINCYTQNGLFFEALKMLKDMYGLGFMPKPELVAGCIATCVRSGNWRLGRVMHALFFVDERMKFSTFVATSLVAFYWRFGDPDMAFRVFDGMVEKNEVSWTAMISGCIEYQDYVRAFDCIRAMQLSDVKPNRVTLVSVLPACAELDSIMHGKEIHGYAVRHGYDSDALFSSSLLHMYCECRGAVKIARRIFDISVNKEVVMWSSMIAGYSQNRDGAREAIFLFNQMQMEGILPNNATILAVISSCTSLSSLSVGAGVHGYSLKSGLGNDLFIQNALINMYSKCGSLEDSLRVFNEMTTKDCISWSCVIGAYGLHGCAGEALQLFDDMQGSGIKADGLTYLAVLSTCNHAGLVDKGRMLFEQALNDGDVSLTLEHYGCYIDLLGRAGEIQAAYDVVCQMPMKASPRTLSCLVSACRLYGRLDIAESVANILVRIEPENAANHTLLSMIYAESDKWDGVEQVRRYMKGRKLKKQPSFSKI
ncbi:hypothetical protein C2S51_000891 [Perilla frutescens var. frutescens]|nr:hypothetical protein C2S51_000891 [Perilla frutescens var. frutescens]